MKALFRLTLQQMLGRRKLWVLLFFLSMPILLVGTILLAGGFRGLDGEEEAVTSVLVLYLLYPQSLCILTSLLYGATLLAAEIEDKTLVYLFTRGQARWKVLVGKYVASVLALAVCVTLSMSAAFALFGAPYGLRAWLALTATIWGGCLTYTAIFSLLGLLVPRRAIPIGILYGIVFEFALSFVPAVINELTTSYYLRSIALRIVGDIDLPLRLAKGLAQMTTDAEQAVVAIALLTGVTLAASCLLIHRREWPLSEGV